MNVPLKKNICNHKIIGVDLFCGAGGLTHGLAQGGIEVAAGIDIDSHCKFPYERNNKSVFLEKDIKNINYDEIKVFFKKNSLKLLSGCAPCQPFSKYNRKSDKINDNKWDLLLSFAKVIDEVKPDLVTMENVPQLIKYEIFKDFLCSLSNYFVWYKIVDCVEYGIPQTRKRLVLLASKFGKIQLLEPTHSKNNPVTVRDTISHLPRISSGESDSLDRLHTSCDLEKLNLKRIMMSKPGGTWRDWPIDLRLKCHTKDTGKTYSSVYGRMKWENPSPTITTQFFGYGNGRFGHPEQNRAISLREAALIQTFPENYEFLSENSPIKFQTLGRLIGNAVPVLLGKVIAKSIMKHVQQLDC